MIETLTQQEQDYFTSQGETTLTDTNEATHEMQATPLEEKAQRFSRTVPHGALHAEREEHKKTRSALAQLKTQHAQILAQLGDAPKQKERPEDNNPPDPTQDFLGFTRWQTATEQNESPPSEEHQLWQVWEQAREMSKSHLPDLDTAIDFLADARERQLRALGQIDTRFQDEKIRSQQMHTELLDLVNVSLGRNENPATMIYELARAYGYGAVNAGERFKELDKAQKAARTLAASNEREAGDSMLMETLAALPEIDFARWYEANPEAFRRLFAG